jgi:hypothetical protein
MDLPNPHASMHASGDASSGRPADLLAERLLDPATGHDVAEEQFPVLADLDLACHWVPPLEWVT